MAIRTTALPHRSIGVTFGHAYYSKSPSGEDQIVLTREPIDEDPQHDPTKPLVRQTSPALNQVLQIQLHWRTAPAGNSDSPVANNAVLHWYVYGDPGDAGVGVVHYVGNGAVSFSLNGSAALISLNNAELTLADQHRPLRDPLGTFQIKAKFKAVADDAQLQQAMDDLNKAIDQTTAATTQKN